MTEKILKKVKPSWKNFEGNLNINKYDTDTLEEKVCSHCLLKSFRKTDLILIREIASTNNCNCLLQLDSKAATNIYINPGKKITLS